MLKNTISTILNENANTDDRKKIIRQYCVWSGVLYLTGGLLAGTAAVWIISYMNHIHKNINQYIQNNGSTGIVLAMVVFFLMACCLLLVTVTAFIRVTVRLCAFVKPSNVKCAELTITGKRQKSANNIRYSMSQYQVKEKLIVINDKQIKTLDIPKETKNNEPTND